MRACYLFESKGIQRWVMEGDRLRDIAAASDLLARVASSDENDLLNEVLSAVGFSAAYSRRAGGAFMLHYDKGDPAFERFRDLWRLAFMQAAPGLEFVESFGEGETDVAAWKMARENPIRRAAGRENGFASLLPLGHPLVAWSQRTGRPAVAGRQYPGEEEQRIDAVTDAKRRFGELGAVGVGARFMPDDADPKPAWPTEMEVETRRADETDAAYNQRTRARGPRLPFKVDSRWIGVVHADISGLGVFYRKISDRRMPNDAAARQFAFDASKAIEGALETAARAATEEILLPNVGRDDEKSIEVMPARPILLGGDDVTIIVRGDLALDWTRRFLVELEVASEEALKDFATTFGEGSNPDIVKTLTACAGVAFGKSKQPFFRLLDLADGLCGFAKKAAKKAARDIAVREGRDPKKEPVASMLAFHRVTESALAADATDLFAALEKNGRRLSAQPYRVGGVPANGYAALEDLAKLTKTLKDGADAFKRGPLRDLRKELLDGSLEGVAKETWSRWQQMAKSRGGEVRMKAFDEALSAAAGGAIEAALPFTKGSRQSLENDNAHVSTSPLFDAIEWEAVS